METDNEHAAIFADFELRLIKAKRNRDMKELIKITAEVGLYLGKIANERNNRIR